MADLPEKSVFHQVQLRVVIHVQDISVVKSLLQGGIAIPRKIDIRTKVCLKTIHPHVVFEPDFVFHFLRSVIQYFVVRRAFVVIKIFGCCVAQLTATNI